MQIEIPQRDAPRAVGLALVTALGLIAGVGLSWWASSGAGDEGRDERAEPPPSRASSAERRAAGEERASARAEAVDGGTTRSSLGSGDAGRPEPIVEAPSAAPDAPSPEEATTPASAAPEPPPLDAHGLAVRRGRIAVLRCEGPRVGRQGSACPRDEPLEASVWAVIEALVACPTGPRSPGEADLRIDYAGASAPSVAWRDTFADEVVRLDSAAVLECVRGPLARTRQSIGAAQLVISFRFAVVSDP